MLNLKIISIILFLIGIFVFILNIPFFQNVQVEAKPDYLANITIPVEVKKVTSIINDRLTVPLILHNKGTSSWDSDGKKVFVSYHLKNKNNELLRFDNIRTALKREIKSAEQIQFDLIINTPEKAGQYKLEIDLVKEGSFWFAQKGSSTLTLDFSVETIFDNWKTAEKSFDLSQHDGSLLWYIENEEKINKLLPLIKYTLEKNTINFELSSLNKHQVYGFFAGAGYPQIWVRDSATISPFSRYLFNDKYLTSWIIAHLSYQKSDGSIADNINAIGDLGKNTVESDQETSLVHGAWLAANLRGYDWLKTLVQGESIVKRLDKAITYLFKHKYDVNTQLITKAHTADWGDVSPDFADQRAVDLHKDSCLVVGIYTQSMLFKAIKQLSFMYKKLGNSIKSEYWLKKSKQFKEQIQKQLWNKKQGFFRVHAHVDCPPHLEFDEDNIFAMGGNSEAILSGLATQEQVKHIFNTAINRSKLFNMSTISGVLLPPYPKGFFRHPALDDYFEYQNGGQWDWFGGRLLLAMYQYNYPDATSQLQKIANKAIKNQDIYEWDSVIGEGKGSKFYSGSAAVIGRAIVEGLFGVNWTNDWVKVNPHFTNKSGYIYLPKVGSKEYVFYSYRIIKYQDRRTINLKIVNNSMVKTKLKLDENISNLKIDHKEYDVNKLDNGTLILDSMKEYQMTYSTN
jgi:cellobiose phosphorylase